MPGAGTRTAITTAEPPVRLLDLTRLLSRVGRGSMTGVDRVEFAYLRQLLNQPVPLFGLIKTRFGYSLLDPSGCRAFQDRLTGRLDWGRQSPVHRLRRKLPKLRRQAESDVGRIALEQCRPAGLSAMLARHLPAGFHYVNVGQSNLNQSIFTAVRAVPEARIVVLIHDTIPLDHAQIQRPGTPAQFARKLQAVAKYADLILCNSEQTRRDVQRHVADWGPCPEILVAFLGVDVPEGNRNHVPADFDLTRPYFVTLGTIEPRKNHGLLLDVWDDLEQKFDPDEIPNLFIIGARGWNNDAVFNRLDRLTKGAGPVREVNGLPDSAMIALMQGATGFLFPSIAEGYGLPPLEALALGVPVLCGDLAIYRETMNNKPIYLPLNDVYQWSQHVVKLTSQNDPERKQWREDVSEFNVPSWTAHFNSVLKRI